MKPLENNHLVTQAALLDPKFKKLAFCNTSATKYKQAFEHLKAKVCSVSLPPSESTATTPSQTPSEGKSSMIWKTFDEQFDLQRGSQNSTSAGIIELDKYMNEPLVRRHEGSSYMVEWPKNYVSATFRHCVEKDVYTSYISSV